MDKSGITAAERYGSDVAKLFDKYAAADKIKKMEADAQAQDAIRAEEKNKQVKIELRRAIHEAINSAYCKGNFENKLSLFNMAINCVESYFNSDADEEIKENRRYSLLYEQEQKEIKAAREAIDRAKSYSNK